MIVPYHVQRNNENIPYTACYNTTMAMITNFILKKEKLKKIDIGCALYQQIEDKIYELIYSQETKKWIKENASKYGTWFLKYKAHTLAAVECYIFNKLMNKYGYSAKFKTNQTFDDYKRLIDKGLPQALHGYFKPETRVKGHVVCGIGYRKDKFVIHDPFGDARSAYKIFRGANVIYPNNHWFHKRRDSMWITTIEQIKP